jgi:hypothetical protein
VPWNLPASDLKLQTNAVYPHASFLALSLLARRATWSPFSWTTEQVRSGDIRDLRKAAYVGQPAGNWLEARNKLFCAGVQPRHWDDAATTLDGQTLAVAWAPWHFGGKRRFFVVDVVERYCSCLPQADTPGDVGTAITLPTHPGR